MLEVGMLLRGRYNILSQVGKGGMGTVFLAKDENLGITVAVKQNFFDEQRLIEAFKREARLLAGLRHSALPQVKDYFIEGAGQYLVMEYIAGDDLGTILQKHIRGTAPAEDVKPFDVHDVVRWAEQLLDALDYLHTRSEPIVHRDIKPQNLKLAERNQIILLDFGLAKGKPLWMTRVTTTGSLYGYTPSYAPIEQIRGLGTDPRSDLYALGATLYHLLTGVPPIDSATRADAFLGREPDPLPPANHLNPKVPYGISAALMKAMEAHRNNRFGSAAEMLEALRDAKGSTVVDWKARNEEQATTADEVRQDENVWPTTELRIREQAEQEQQVAEEARQAQEEGERSAREEAKRIREQEAARREQTERKQREEKERKALEETERLRLEREGALEAQREAEQRQKAAVERKQREEHERLQREEAERLKQERERELKAQQEAERQRKEERERNAREQAERKRREEKDRDEREEAERKQKEEEDRKAKEVAERQRLEEEKRRSQELAESLRLEQEKVEREAREAEARRQREEAEQRARDETHRKQLEEEESAAAVWAEEHLRQAEERRAKEEEEKLRREREHKVRWQAEQLRKRVEQEGKARDDAAQKKLQEEQERKVREEAKRLAQQQEETRRQLAREDAERWSQAQQEQPEARETPARTQARTVSLIGGVGALLLLVISIWFGVSTSKQDKGPKPGSGPIADAPQASQPGKSVAAHALEPGSFATRNRVVKVALSDDGGVLASAGDETSVRLWQASGTRELIGHTQNATSVAVSHDGQFVASGSFDGMIRLWRVSDGQVIKSWSGHSDNVFSVGFSPDGTTVYSAGGDKTIKIWRPTDGVLINTVSVPKKNYVIVAISPDMGLVGFYRDDGSFEIWSLVSNQLISMLRDKSPSVNCGAFSKDGLLLALGIGKGIQVWRRVTDGRLDLQGVGAPVMSVALTSDGQTLAAGFWNGAIQVWNVQDGRPIHIFDSHTKSVNSLAFSADGRTLASGSDDGSVRVWNVAERVVTQLGNRP
jgi:hypothetical protein